MKQENRGGARAGAGKKPRAFSEEFKEDLKKELDKKAKETGLTFQRILVDLAYDKRQSATARATFCKIIASTFVVKESHKVIENNGVVGVVMLPAVQAAPLRIVEGSGPVIDGATGEIMDDSHHGDTEAQSTEK